MAELSQRLVRKGRPEKLDQLKKQAGYTREQVVLVFEVLKEHGLGADFLSQYDAAVLALASCVGTQKENRDQAKSLVRSEESARRNAKSFKRKIGHAVKLTLEENDPSKLTVADFLAGPAETSSARLGVYLDRIAPHVKTLDDRLKDYFKGASPYELLGKVRTDLHNAEAEQNRALANAPIETLALYEAKGRLLELIERANRVARIAFDGDAVMCARFNKDLLLRGGKAKGKAQETEEETTDPGAEAVPA